MFLTVFAVGAIKYSLCKFRKSGNVRISFPSCAQLSSPDMSVIVFAVGSIEYVLYSFRPLAYFRLTIHKYTHLPSPDNVYAGFAVDSFIRSATLFNLATSESLFMHTLTCQRSPTVLGVSVLGVYKKYHLCILLHVMNSD